MNSAISRAWCLLILCAAFIGVAAADPYVAWASGHPADAVPALEDTARTTGRWDAWYDAGLAAAAAGDRTRSAADLLVAHRIAPERDEPRTALRANGTPLPTTWCDQLGPVIWPGTGVAGIVVLGLAGLAVGWAIAGRRARASVGVAGGVLLILAAPGVVATRHDAQQSWAVIAQDTQLLDSTGTPQQPLAAATLVLRDPAPAWAGRALVTLTDGKRGFVAESDVR
jgi:hypothetical protein